MARRTSQKVFLTAKHTGFTSATTAMEDFNLLSWRNILLSLAGDHIAEARCSTATPTIASVFGDEQPEKINGEVYALHDPVARPTLEVVFFHGLELGDYQESYWRNWLCADEKHCWPKTWLSGDWPNARVLSVAYDSSLMKTSTTGRLDLYSIVENLKFTLIDDARVGQNNCPVIFVGHSLGGVVMKALCARAKQGYPSCKKRRREDLMDCFVDNLKGLFFLATPHGGSIFSDRARSSLVGPLMIELEVLNSQTVRLNRDFVQFLNQHPSIKLWGVGESQPTQLGKFFDMVVPEGSARFSNYHDYHTAPADHFGICKLESKKNSTYKFLTRFLRNIINEAENRGVDSETALQAPSNFSFSSDRRYILLKQTEEKVITALKHSGGSPVILLHGASGTGKSALARNLALRFQKEIKEKIDAHAHCNQQAYTSGPEFDRVLYMECGPEVKLPAKKKYLAEQLAPSAISTLAARDTDNLDNEITEALQGLLKDKPLLIILDDVWECEGESSQQRSNFLQGMVRLGGERVKWLVTSQSQDLCRGLNIGGGFCPVRMEEVKPEDGRRILAALAGVEISALSPEIQDIMGEIVGQTGGNLLALTCVASTIGEERNKQVAEWKRLKGDLLDVLDCPASISMHDIRHGRSFWGAIRLGFQRLSRAQKNLLILIHMCEGPSVSSDVVEYLFKQTQCQKSFGGFLIARNALQGRNLLTIKTTSDPALGDKERWSIHDLLRVFIKREVFGEDNGISTVDKLAKEEIMFKKGSRTELEHDVVIGVASLYFGHKFAEKMGMSSWMSKSADLGRQVIDPIAHLLGLTEDEQWTSALRSSIFQVLVKYVRHREFDAESTSSLLNSPISKVPILCSLHRSAWNFVNNHLDHFVGQHIILALFRLLEEITLVIKACPNSLSPRDYTVLDWTLSAFAVALGNRQDKNYTSDLSDARLQTIIERLMLGLGVVADSLHSNRLVEISQKSENMSFTSVRVVCARALGTLAGGGGGMKEKMIDFLELLESLVIAMRTKDSPILQEEAGRAIINLASPSSGATEIIGLKIVNYPGVLDALVDGPDSSKNGGFMRKSAWALANLAGIPGHQIKWKIIMFEGAVRRLIFAMVNVDDNDVRKRCVRAIDNVARGGNDIRMKIKVDFPEILDVLENVVARGEKSGDDIYHGMVALTLLDPLKAKAIQVSAAEVYLWRGQGELLLRLYKDAREDLDRYEGICTLEQNPNAEMVFRMRCCAKAKLGDLQDALADADSLVSLKWTQFALQERGVVKCMLGDLRGALEDLNASLRLSHEDDYEVLKHRGLVHFMMNDEESARADAERAIQCKPSRVNDANYGHSYLGASSVRYLDFELK